MSLEEDLKRVIPASKEVRAMMEELKKMPPATLEQAKRQARASREFQEKYDRDDRNINTPRNE